jgi:hypothetical protein
VTVCNALHDLAGALDIEASGRSHGYAPNVDTHLLTRRDIRSNQVAGLEAMHASGPGQVPAREAIPVQACALIAAAARAFHHEGRLSPGAHSSNLTHAYGIERMGFRDAKPRTVELRATARSQLYRQVSSTRGQQPHIA